MGWTSVGGEELVAGIDPIEPGIGVATSQLLDEDYVSLWLLLVEDFLTQRRHAWGWIDDHDLQSMWSPTRGGPGPDLDDLEVPVHKGSDHESCVDAFAEGGIEEAAAKVHVQSLEVNPTDELTA